MKRILVLCLAAAVVLPLRSAGAGPPPSLAFAFGRQGGSIMPFQVKIFTDGKVSVTGAVHRIEPVTVSQPSLAALRKLARAERFFSMPALTHCPQRVSGLATNYIRIRIGKLDKTVSDYGGCNKGFVELYDVLKAVAAISTESRGA
jgi:hypothetical protein